MKNLLYLQPELAYLEKQLEKQHEEDEESGDEVREFFDTSWKLLSNDRNVPDRNTKQWDLMTRIGAALSEYSISTVLRCRLRY